MYYRHLCTDVCPLHWRPPERLNFLYPTLSSNMTDVLNSEMGQNHVLI